MSQEAYKRSLFDWARWFLFSLLLFLWLGGLSEVAGLGRIRLAVAGLVAISFGLRQYVQAWSELFSQRQTVIGLLLLGSMSASWFIWGERNEEGGTSVLRNAVSLFMLMMFIRLDTRSA